MVDLQRGDCLELMKNIPDKSVDMILCDLPYGTTACKWDSVIPFDRLWKQYMRIIKDRRAIVLFAGEPFASNLRISNLDWYKYDWVYVKNSPAGFVNAKLKPMNKHEILCVFSNGKTSNGNKNNMLYHPQGLILYNKKRANYNKKERDNSYWRPSTDKNVYIQSYTNYPTTVLEFAKPTKAIHPTQKPLALLERIIQASTKPDAIVFDPFMGSGTTGVAALKLGRKFVGVDSEKAYCELAEKRINAILAQLPLAI